MTQKAESEKILSEITKEMFAYYAGDNKRIFHFLKVHALAKQIAVLENLSSQDLFTLETAALTHDIGIKKSEEKYHSASGHYQQIEGPPLAEELLRKIGIPEDMIARVCYLIGHHHDYAHIDGIDYQILIEADFLVNMQETDGTGKGCLRRKQYFKTSAGKRMCAELFGVKVPG
jgi:predicted metal-dependent HD superfamily phosphohydrolase